MVMPLISAGIPNVYRVSPLTIALPTSDRSRPIAPLRSPLTRLPADRLAMMVRPNTASQKNSGGPKLNAKRASGGASSTNDAIPTMPPTADARQARVSASSPSPRLAMGNPSNVVAIDCGVPGVFSKIAANAPP